MKTQVNFNAFQEAFERHGRSDQFGYQGLRILFDYLEELEKDIGEEIELDVIALCCDYQVASEEEINVSYDIEEENTEEFLADKTSVLGGFVDKEGGKCYVFAAF